MNTKYERIYGMFEDTKSEITKDIESYKSYLQTASRVYKYNFDEQVLIHAQKPEATACASMDFWNSKMGRWVKGGSKGIALIHRNIGQKPRLEYVFDVSDTKEVEGAKKPFLWRFKEPYKDGVTSYFEEKYGEVENPDFETALLEFCERATGELYRDYTKELGHDLEDSFLDGLDEQNIELKFKEAMDVSVKYTVFTRCGLDPMKYIDDEDFNSILEFNTPEVLSYLGNAVNIVSKNMLVDIGIVAKRLEKNQHIDYNKDRNEFNVLKRESEQKEKQDENDVHKQEFIPNTELDDGIRQPTRERGKIWEASSNIPREQPNTEKPDVSTEYELLETHSGNGRVSENTSRTNDNEDVDGTRSKRETESTRPNALGEQNEQYQSTSRGNSLSRDNKHLENDIIVEQLGLFPSEEQQLNIIADKHNEINVSKSAISFEENEVIFFNKFEDVNVNLSRYNDGEVIGYDENGVKYSVGKSGHLSYVTTTTSLDGYGRPIGTEMGIETAKKFFDWRNEQQDNIEYSFDGGSSKDVIDEKPLDVEKVPKINYKIQNDELGHGTKTEKFDRNILAIKTLKDIEENGRFATPQEQEIISNYIGFGGLSEVFDIEKDPSRYNQLKGLLTEDEFTSARASTLTAHYTSPVVIKAMYEALENMGIPTDGNVLDPALGSGNFFGTMPEFMKDYKMYGVELDGLTGRLAKQLYPNANIQIKGFEKTSFENNFFDIAVGNVPFGDFRVNDSAYNKQNFLIHDYFFAKTLDKVRAGGVVAFITSKGTLDKTSKDFREHLASKADLLGAIRLPNTAFKSNAGTEVTSDIIFLQKRENPPEKMPDWLNIGADENGISVNEYFAQNPNMILGKMEMVSGQFGMEATCKPNTETTLAEQLSEAITHITKPNKELLSLKVERNDENEVNSIPATDDVKNFSFTVIDEKIYYRENSRMHEIITNDRDYARLIDIIEVRNATREVIDLQMNDCTDKDLKEAQVKLNNVYDKFSKKHGLINSKVIKKTFSDDVSYPLLCSLEHLDENGKLKAKADMFSKRTIKQKVTITSVDTPTEALAVSISEKACVDIEFMCKLLGGEDKLQTLIDRLKGIIFKDPYEEVDDEFSGWQTADEYLSGNVREKLKVANMSSQLNERFSDNVKWLEKVQPIELEASEIDVRIGATWIDPKYYKQFMFELLGTPQFYRYSDIDIKFAPRTGEWNVIGKSVDRSNPKATTTFGTSRKNAYYLLEDSLNLRDTRVYDTVYVDGKEKREVNSKETTLVNQKQEQISEEFKDWVWKDPDRRAELTATYNKLFNSTRPREFDGQHIKFDGMTPEITLNTHQSNAVARTLYGDNTLLAHCVGAGKTFTMIASAMEGKRLGLNQKSLFVVPNHLTEQMGADVYRLYPGAKVLVATKKDFEPANRKTFCSRIATGDFDVVVIGHTQFEKIPLSVARQEQIFKNQIDDIMNAIAEVKGQEGQRFTVKQLEKTQKALEVRLEKLTNAERKDDVVTFEELGVDKLYVDEAHLFKNLFLHTKMRNVAGIGQSEAQKSSDMFSKCQYMDELTGGRGIVFATGTPVSNSMTELYTMMRYLQYDTLKKMNLENFDSWASQFGEKVTAIELAPEGTGFRSKTRFAKFFNLPELIKIWKEATDIQTADMLNLPVPEVEHITVSTEPSESQVQMVKELGKRADDVRNRRVDASVDNMLKITSDGRKLALDQRLHNDLLSDGEESKINVCVENIHKIWEDTTETKGAQVVFCDLSTPHYDGSFNVYDDIKNKLISKGVNNNEIAYIHDAKTEQQKADLFANVRKGNVRVIIGSTAKMGAGTNIQERLVALHHTDCPWRPSDLEQREGRIIRQGNTNKNVKVFKYVTKNTFDAYNWSIIENKQKFIGQVFTSKSPARSADDVDATALSYAEVKALATGDPRIKEKMDLDVSVAKLKLARSTHLSQCYKLQDNVVKLYPVQIKSTADKLEGLKKDVEVLKENPIVADRFNMKVDGVNFDERKLAGEKIIELCATLKNMNEILKIGEYRGFDLSLHQNGFNTFVDIKANTTITVEIEKNAVGIPTRINNAVESIPVKIVELEEKLVRLNDEMKSAEIECAKPFAREEEYKDKVARLTKLNKELDNASPTNDENEKTDVEEITEDLVEGKQERPSVLAKLSEAKKQVSARENNATNNIER